MILSTDCINLILEADGKALATMNSDAPHVVPVSSVKVIDNKIVLVNYFFGKTLENILANPNVSLAVWQGLKGYQIKSVAEYQTEGEIFKIVKEWIGEILPDRLVKGVIILTPTEIFDVSAGSNAGNRVSE